MKASGKKRSLLFFTPLVTLGIILLFSLSAIGAEYDFRVITDKSSYSTHSTVKIRLLNTGSSPLNLRNMWWMVEIREGGVGREVYTGDPNKPAGAPNILQPGEHTTWTWNTKDNEGVWQPAGRYRVKITITMPVVGYEGIKTSDGFDLVAGGGGGPAEVSLTSDRKVYHRGNVVTFTITNTGNIDLDTSTFSWVIYRLYDAGPVARSTHTVRPAGVPDPISPGESASWSWDMRNNQGNFVGADNYELEVQLPDAGTEANCFFRVGE
jgi:hypothetical protein